MNLSKPRKSLSWMLLTGCCIGAGLVGCSDGLRPVGSWLDARGLSGIPEAFRSSLEPSNLAPLPFPGTQRYEVGWRSLHEIKYLDPLHSGHAASAMLVLHAGWTPTDLPAGPADPADGRVYPLDPPVIGVFTAAFRPDPEARLGGTPPLVLVKMLTSRGMTAHYSMKGDLEGIRRWVDAGWPAALLVDGSRLGGSTRALVWVVIHGLDERQVAIANAPDGSRTTTAERLLAAWDADGFPLRGAAVVAEGIPR